MTETTRTAPRTLPPRTPAAARSVLRLLQRLHVGVLDLQLPDGSQARFGTPRAGEPQAAFRIADWSVFGAALRRGDIGFAEAFIDGRWTSPDVVALLKLLLANRDALEAVVYGRWWGSLLDRVRHLLNRNSRRGSRRNIHAHYDIGNPFYRLWLDETMNYSSALFEGDTTRPMAAAQRAKVMRALREVQLQPGQRVLINGASGGVGTFAVQIAKVLGGEVTAVVSTRKLEMARSLGADHTIDYTQEDFSQAGQAYDLIFDTVGNRSVAEYERALVENGRFVTTTFLPALLWPRPNRSQKMVNMLARPNQRDLAFLAAQLAAGQVTPVIDRCFPLAEAPTALRYLAAGHARGKGLITMQARQ